MENEKIKIIVKSLEEKEKMEKMLMDNNVEGEIVVQEPDNTIGIKVLIEKLNNAKLPKEFISKDIEVFTDYKVKKLLENGLIDGRKGESNKEGYRFDVESVEKFIEKRKRTKEDILEREKELEQRVKDLEAENTRLKQKYLSSAAIEKVEVNGDICEGQMSIDDILNEEPVTLDGIKVIINEIREKSQLGMQSIVSLANDIFDEEVTLGGNSKVKKWDTLINLLDTKKHDLATTRNILKQVLVGESK